MNKRDNKTIPILSFFSGGGFLDMGFEKAGFEVVWTNEYDKVFAQLHEAGVTSWRKSRGNQVKAKISNMHSIAEIDAETIINEAFPLGKPKKFGVIGGPPCQDFSMNGKLKGFTGERGRLTEVYLERIVSLLPTFFVMENVTGLLKRQETKEYLLSLLKRVEGEYFIDYKILNALDFGVPQHRERVFFVGIHKKCVPKTHLKHFEHEGWLEFHTDEKYSNASKKYAWAKPNVFGADVLQPAEVPIELCVKSCLVPNEEIDSVPNANEIFNLYVSNAFLSSIKEGETNRPSFKRLHRFKYSPTACYGNNEVHLHPYENRRLSVREVLRIQGVPDEYVLPSDLSVAKKIKMIGNGVPMPLAEAVAKTVKSLVEEKTT